jgi:hypothetical protein
MSLTRSATGQVMATDFHGTDYHTRDSFLKFYKKIKTFSHDLKVFFYVLADPLQFFYLLHSFEFMK